MTKRTNDVLEAIRSTVAMKDCWIVPGYFAHCYGGVATAEAIKLAKQQGLIRLAYVSQGGSPVYKGMR